MLQSGFVASAMANSLPVHVCILGLIVGSANAAVAAAAVAAVAGPAAGVAGAFARRFVSLALRSPASSCADTAAPADDPAALLGALGTGVRAARPAGTPHILPRTLHGALQVMAHQLLAEAADGTRETGIGVEIVVWSAETRGTVTGGTVTEGTAMTGTRGGTGMTIRAVKGSGGAMGGKHARTAVAYVHLSAAAGDGMIRIGTAAAGPRRSGRRNAARVSVTGATNRTREGVMSWSRKTRAGGLTESVIETVTGAVTETERRQQDLSSSSQLLVMVTGIQVAPSKNTVATAVAAEVSARQVLLLLIVTSQCNMPSAVAMPAAAVAAGASAHLVPLLLVVARQ